MREDGRAGAKDAPAEEVKVHVERVLADAVKHAVHAAVDPLCARSTLVSLMLLLRMHESSERRGTHRRP